MFVDFQSKCKVTRFFRQRKLFLAKNIRRQCKTLYCNSVNAVENPIPHPPPPCSVRTPPKQTCNVSNHWLSQRFNS